MVLGAGTGPTPARNRARHRKSLAHESRRRFSLHHALPPTRTRTRKRRSAFSQVARPLAEGGQYVIWRKNSDVAESAKILGIERQQIRNSMHAHRCHHASVVDLDTGDARRNYDSAPLLMCCFAVGGKREFGFDQSCAFIRLCNRESEPVPISRSSTDVPEFSQILRCVEEVRSAVPKDDPYIAGSFHIRGCPAVRGGAKCSCPPSRTSRASGVFTVDHFA